MLDRGKTGRRDAERSNKELQKADNGLDARVQQQETIIQNRVSEAENAEPRVESNSSASTSSYTTTDESTNDASISNTGQTAEQRKSPSGRGHGRRAPIRNRPSVRFR